MAVLRGEYFSFDGASSIRSKDSRRDDQRRVLLIEYVSKGGYRCGRSDAYGDSQEEDQSNNCSYRCY